MSKNNNPSICVLYRQNLLTVYCYFKHTKIEYVGKASIYRKAEQIFFLSFTLSFPALHHNESFYSKTIRSHNTVNRKRLLIPRFGIPGNF